MATPQKTCTKCSETKAVTNFHKDRSKQSGYGSQCKQCRHKYFKERDIKRWQGFSEDQKKNRRSQIAEWKKNHPDKVRQYSRKHKLYRDYGISEAGYQKLYANQEGRCAICQQTSGKKNMAVDHDHHTGKVRGLLCINCNLGLGSFFDYQSLLNNALKYLNKYQKN